MLAGAAIAVLAGYTTSHAAAGSTVELGQKMAAAKGWTGGQWTCLYDLWTKESGWSATAANPASDARGIAQKISGWSADYPYGDARPQITWGISYVKNRYGTPCAAWNFEISHQPNWY